MSSPLRWSWQSQALAGLAALATIGGGITGITTIVNVNPFSTYAYVDRENARQDRVRDFAHFDLLEYQISQDRLLAMIQTFLLDVDDPVVIAINADIAKRETERNQIKCRLQERLPPC